MVCIIMMVAARLALLTLGLARVRVAQSRLLAVARRPWLGRRSLEAILTAVDSASAWTPGATCLVRALAGQLLAAAYGYRLTLRMGLRAQAGIEGHAWLEQDGRPCPPAGEAQSYFPLELSIEP